MYPMMMMLIVLVFLTSGNVSNDDDVNGVVGDFDK